MQKQNNIRLFAKRLLASALSASVALSGPLHALTDIADYPITQPATSSLNPNLLLILDDSGSMGRQFSPDYVSTNVSAGTTRNCFDSADGDNTVTGATADLDECWPGDVPAMSPDFNSQYYNPEVRYLPAVDYDGTQRLSMTAANTTNWTRVPTDSVSSAAIDRARKNLTSGTNWDTGNSPIIEELDLTTQWPDRVWCIAQADTATDTARCKTNSSYTYPDFTYSYGLTTGGNRKYKFGGPYYYRIQPTVHCVDARLDDCIAAEDDTQIVAGKAYKVPAPVRFCTDQNATNCHAKRSGSRLHPSFVGNVLPAVAADPGDPAIGRITVLNQTDTAAGALLRIEVTTSDGTTVAQLSNGATLPASQTASQWADALVTEINSLTGTHGFTAGKPSAGSSSVNITQPPPNSVFWNGATINVVMNVSATTTPARIAIVVTNVVRQNGGSSASQISALTVQGTGGYDWVPTTVVCNHNECNSNTSSTRNNRMAQLLFDGLVPPSGWTKSYTAGTNTVTLTAPTGTGSEKNGHTVTISRNNMSSWAPATQLSGGVTTGDMEHTTDNFTGGSDPVTAASKRRAGVGKFVRTNIASGQLYNRFAGRTDCVTTTGKCTYEEEMTNFANWFSYYRTRMQMAKTAIGRAIALAALPDNWRLGFMTINFASSDYLAVAPFTTGVGAQRNNWYTKLYGADASGGTPLRTALSRAGRYFSDRNPDSMGQTPINSACQPNFTILTSDGYWNDSSGAVRFDGTTNVGDVDKDGSSNTLADVAAYYYNNDLLPEPVAAPRTVAFKNQVPPSGIDTAPHQHMTTFTVGLGISGTLLFHPNYLEPGNSIDYDLIAGTPGKTGTNAWPKPVADTDTTVDDLWHAAVNGKGRFFSAQNPVALAAGINEVLNSVAQRVGAGAAAATSNLQPVAGDNFAFTAQYATVEWTGDVKARTISLVDGVISERQLWSASNQLDQRTYANRRIYTFDAADTNPALTVTVGGTSRLQNGNRLRSFCPIDASLVEYPTCTDGALLTDAEMNDNFDPLGGASGALTQAGGWPTGDPRRDAATKISLIDFLRGATANEAVLGGTGATDLYRNRVHLLGDIVNAQPAYVRSSPFSYSSATDPFYFEFRNSTNGTAGVRKGTVYVAANDGMLHAFETDPDNNPYYQTASVSVPDDPTNDKFTGSLDTNPVTGEGAERWAYVPSLLFSTVKRLAEINYATNHRYFVDGSPQIGDVCFGHTTSTPCTSKDNWHTILVGGLNQGGRGYYALDVTDPDNPKGLWEVKGGSAAACLTDAEANGGTFSEDCNIGSTFGNPIIVKRPQDGRWVVLVTSGYNNVGPGDGKGYLYVLDAQTGRILRRMGTGVGSATPEAPSGLARINAWVDDALNNNLALTVYGGDLEGNLWRFQLDDTAGVPRHSVTRLATVVDPTGVAQPITVRPELAQIDNQRVVYFGTGRFLGSSDKVNNQRQSIYAIKDTMLGTTSPMVSMARSGLDIPGFVRQDLTEVGTDQRTVTTINPVSWTADSGWFIDLPDGGTGGEAAERVSVDPIIQLGTLVVPSNVPSSETCVAGGFGWVNFLNIRDGGTVQTGTADTPASVKVSGSLIVGINVVKIGENIKTIVTTADNQQLTKETPVTPSTMEGRRVTWRELVVE